MLATKSKHEFDRKSGISVVLKNVNWKTLAPEYKEDVKLISGKAFRA